jgi:hypothetical protein
MGKDGNEACADCAVQAAADIGAMAGTMAGWGGSEGL